jgi:hypothetical protein
MPAKVARVSSGSFSTGSSQQQVRPCPLSRRKRKSIQSISDATMGRCGSHAENPRAIHLESRPIINKTIGGAATMPTAIAKAI